MAADEDVYEDAEDELHISDPQCGDDDQGSLEFHLHQELIGTNASGMGTMPPTSNCPPSNPSPWSDESTLLDEETLQKWTRGLAGPLASSATYIERRDSLVRCRMCSQVTWMDAMSLAQHLSSERHQATYGQLEQLVPIVEDPLVAVWNGKDMLQLQFYCLACAASVGTIQQTINHIQFNRHKRALARTSSSMIESVRAMLDDHCVTVEESREEWCCGLCTTTVKSPMLMLEHYQSPRHKKKQQRLDGDKSIVVQLDEPGKRRWQCVLCDSNLNTYNSVHGHLTSPCHQSRLVEKQKETPLSKSQTDQLVERHADGTRTCLVCNQLLKSQKSLRKHVGAESHLRMLQHFSPEGDTGTFWCSLCRVRLPGMVSLISHCAGKKHRKKVGATVPAESINALKLKESLSLQLGTASKGYHPVNVDHEPHTLTAETPKATTKAVADADFGVISGTQSSAGDNFDDDSASSSSSFTDDAPDLIPLRLDKIRSLQSRVKALNDEKRCLVDHLLLQHLLDPRRNKLSAAISTLAAYERDERELFVRSMTTQIQQMEKLGPKSRENIDCGAGCIIS